MMVCKFSDDIVFNCDNCGELIDTETKSFRDSLDFIKSEGWIISKDEEGKWMHFCNESCTEGD